MATTVKARTRGPVTTAIEEYVTPGRRRTDNPLVVGTVVLCLGIIAVGQVVQTGATLWAGSQVKVLLTTQKTRDEETDLNRARLFKNTEAQINVVRRLCLNTAKDDKDKTECLAVGPPLSPVKDKEAKP